LGVKRLRNKEFGSNPNGILLDTRIKHCTQLQGMQMMATTTRYYCYYSWAITEIVISFCRLAKSVYLKKDI
jgi:hypothetical protein